MIDATAHYIGAFTREMLALIPGASIEWRDEGDTLVSRTNLPSGYIQHATLLAEIDACYSAHDMAREDARSIVEDATLDGLHDPRRGK